MRLPALAALALAACTGAASAPPPDAATAPLPDAATADAASSPADAAPDGLCCTDELCAATATACRRETCRCEQVSCDACDHRGLPGVDTRLVCQGPSCFAAVDEHEQCPAGVPSADCGEGSRECVCYGETWCRVFVDDCTAGGWNREGEPCDRTFGCERGLLCYRGRCRRPGCGLSQGAPDCPPSKVCRFIDTFRSVGVCRQPCAGSPCAANEVCEDGACVGAGELPLPRAGEPCTDWPPACAAGLLCVAGRCVVECGAGCPAGETCVPWAFTGFCAAPCDAWSPSPDTSCRAWETCTLGAGVDAHCVPTNALARPPGERCQGWCTSAFVCSHGLARRCRPPCIVGATTGRGACPAGERCFAATRGEWTRVRLPYGSCDRPCEPGGSDCPAGSWCEPLERDPTTDAWVGICL